MRRRTWVLATAGLAALAALAVLLVATRVFPSHSINHDEGVYLHQAAMLLDGQLFLRPPVPDSFRPWFFVADGGRLYPKYAPVPAATFAVGRLLGGYRLALVAVAAGNVALVAGVVGSVFDRHTGLLAAAFVLASPLFLLDSSVFLPYAPTTLLNLTFLYAYLRADRADDPRWGAVAGGAVGLAFFARPYTAVLFALPVIGHALWTLRTDWPGALRRQVPVAALGLAGVGVALAYNAVVTGSLWTFPYQAFGPQDGLGFGHRELLGHAVRYTPWLALRANAHVLAAFVTRWFVGGLLGTALALGGVAVAWRRDLSDRAAILLGQLGTITVGNVYFWGSYNIAGDLGRAGDGLLGALGPYYHFDLLLPAAAFAAVGALAVAESLRSLVAARYDPARTRAVVSAALLVGALCLGGVTAANASRPVEENLAATRTYERVYDPFATPPTDAVVFLPTPYGDWLAHPFQALRNDPDFDGPTVYALPDHPFAVADAYPDRELYRLVYRGPWSPRHGSPDAVRLRRVRTVEGATADMTVTAGIPSDDSDVTLRVATDRGNDTHALGTVSKSLTIEASTDGNSVRIVRDGEVVTTLPVGRRDTVRLTVFVDRGLGGSFSYRVALPIEAANGTVRALTPMVERCAGVRICGGSAAYIPERAPSGVFVRTDLGANASSPARATGTGPGVATDA